MSADIFGQCLIDIPGGGGGEVTHGKFGRGEPLQKPSNPDTVEKKIVHFTTLFKSQDLFS